MGAGWKLYRIHVGIGETGEGRAIPPNMAQEETQLAQARLALWLGGSASWTVHGTWDGGATSETGAVIEVLSKRPDAIEDVRVIADQLRERLHQESVLISVVDCETHEITAQTTRRQKDV